MATSIRKFTRLAVYAFLLVITAFVSALFGNKRNSESSYSSFSLIPPAHADVSGGPADASPSGSDAGPSCGDPSDSCDSSDCCSA